MSRLAWSSASSPEGTPRFSTPARSSWTGIIGRSGAAVPGRRSRGPREPPTARRSARPSPWRAPTAVRLGPPPRSELGAVGPSPLQEGAAGAAAGGGRDAIMGGTLFWLLLWL